MIMNEKPYKTHWANLLLAGQAAVPQLIDSPYCFLVLHKLLHLHWQACANRDIPRDTGEDLLIAVYMSGSALEAIIRRRSEDILEHHLIAAAVAANTLDDLRFVRRIEHWEYHQLLAYQRTLVGAVSAGIDIRLLHNLQ